MMKKTTNTTVNLVVSLLFIFGILLFAFQFESNNDKTRFVRRLNFPDPKSIVSKTEADKKFQEYNGKEVTSKVLAYTEGRNDRSETSALLVPFVPLLQPHVTDPWTRELFGRLDRIRFVCGDLCSIVDRESYENHRVKGQPEGIFPHMEANVDCDAIMKSEDIDAGDTTVPYPPPDALLPYYTLNGMIEFGFHTAGKLANIYLGGDAKESVWSQTMVSEYLEQLKVGTLPGTYNAHVTNIVNDRIKAADVAGKRVLVVGSELPWVEVICLYHGAAEVTTLEYGAIRSEHPQLKTLTPAQMREAYKENRLEKFDVIVSWSSLEHAGLGRYGDALNPWGDVLAVARAWCVTKPGGRMLLGIPTGRDKVEFNAHRWYGSVRWPLVATNWKNIDSNFNGFPTEHASNGFLFEKA